MSYITNVVLHVDCAPDEVEEKLTEPFDTRGTIEESLGKLDTEPAGGTKVFMGDLYCGAFNYLNNEALLRWLKDVVEDTLTRGVLSIFSESDFCWVYLIDEGTIKEADGKSLEIEGKE